jgi:hypothetical protein
LISASLAHALHGQSILPPSRAATLRVAVVRELAAVADSVLVQLRVDALPLPPDADTSATFTAAEMRTMSDSTVGRKMSDLRSVGLRIADESVRSGCASTGLPWMPDSLHKGCPNDPTLYAVIGTARLGGTLRRPGIGTEMEQGKGYWSVRVLLSTVSKYGVNQEVDDFVMSEQDGAWKLVRRVVLLDID